MNEKADKTVMEWRVHLARRRPQKAAGVVGIILLCGLIVQLSLRNPLLAGLSVLLLAAAAGEFLFPIHYRLTERGAYMRNLLTFKFLAWEDVRRCYRGPAGIKLSPLARRGWREAFRGIHIWVENDEQEKVAEVVRALRPSQGISKKGDAADKSEETIETEQLQQ